MRKNSLSSYVLALLAGSALLHPAFAQAPKIAAAAAPVDKASSYSETYKQLNLFGDVFERVRSQYVEPVEDKKLIENALNGMLSSLDPHSGYLNEESFADMQVTTKGEFGGLGIEVTMEDGLVKVVSPIDDTPAFRAGVQAGDYIVSIDDQTVMGLSLPEAVDKMRGRVGSSIKLLIRRKDVPDPIEYNIVRDTIKIQSVKFETKGNAGYIRITTFSQNTDEGVRHAVEEIKKKLGNKLIGYVIDLRNNPGGLLNQAIAVSDDFIESGEIVSTRGREASDTKRDNATPGDIATGLPIVVLINGGSASASEIVSGALQDHKRAILLGTKSFGKGSVQTVIPLPGHGAIRLTTARYYTPSGRSIQALGIEPDIAVEQAKIETLAANPYGLHEADLKGALKNDTLKDGVNKDGSAPVAAQKGTTPAAPVAAPLPQPSADDTTKVIKGKDLKKAEDAAKEDVQDYQLLRAIDLLNGVSLYKAGTQN